jgi:hypothetical protein
MLKLDILMQKALDCYATGHLAELGPVIKEYEKRRAEGEREAALVVRGDLLKDLLINIIHTRDNG